MASAKQNLIQHSYLHFILVSRILNIQESTTVTATKVKTTTIGGEIRKSNVGLVIL